MMNGTIAVLIIKECQQTRSYQAEWKSHAHRRRNGGGEHWGTVPPVECEILTLTLARTGEGGGAPPPLRFFADSEKTAANLARFLAKKIDRVRSGHGAMMS